MGVDYAAVSAISGLNAQRYAAEMELQKQAQTSPEAQARAGLYRSEGNLNTIRGGLLPGQTQADIDEAKARAALSQAQATQTGVETKYIGPKTLSDIFLQHAQGGYYGSEAARNNRLGFGFPIGATNTGGVNGYGFSLPGSSLTANPLLQDYPY